MNDVEPGEKKQKEKVTPSIEEETPLFVSAPSEPEAVKFDVKRTYALEDSIKEVQKGLEKTEGLKTDLENLKTDLKETKKETRNYTYYAIIFLSVSFVIAMFVIYLDVLLSKKTEREIFINYTNLQQQSFNRYIELKDDFFKEKARMDDLKTLEIENIKNDIRAVEEMLNCFNVTEYDQYKECFE